MKKLFLFGVIFFFCNLVYAGPGTGVFKIKMVHVERGHVYIFPVSAIPDDLECGYTDRIKLVPTDDGFDEMYSLALTAFAADRSVAFWLQACDPSPWGTPVAKAYAGQIKM
mgnify:CR=1 FL=1